MKLSVAVDSFLLSKRVAGCSLNTLRNYKHRMGRFVSYVEGDPELAAVTAENIRGFMAYLMSERFELPSFGPRKDIKLWAKTLRNIHTCLSSLWTWAIGEGYASKHLVRAVQAPKPEAPVMEPYAQGQIRALLQATHLSRLWRTASGRASCVTCAWSIWI